MKKNTFYFTHDYHARNDIKLVKLRMTHGMAGLGLYWCLIEMLYESEGSLHLRNFNTLSFELQVPIDLIEDVVLNHDLFVNDGEMFWSESIHERLSIRNEMAENGKKMAKKRWNNANAMRSHTEGNADEDDTQCGPQCDEDSAAMVIKERKGKEIKGKESKGKEIIEIHEFSDFIDQNCDNLKKMKTAMNAKQATELSSIYGHQAVCEILLAMNNKPDIAKKYASVGQTARQWLKNRKTEQNGKQTFTDHATQWLQKLAEHRAGQHRQP